jgi:hypothetical protein
MRRLPLRDRCGPIVPGTAVVVMIVVVAAMHGQAP